MERLLHRLDALSAERTRQYVDAVADYKDEEFPSWIRAFAYCRIIAPQTGSGKFEASIVAWQAFFVEIPAAASRVAPRNDASTLLEATVHIAQTFNRNETDGGA